MSEHKVAPTVILWVHPRSCSTMFECAILQRKDDFEVLHEPMGDAFYFGPERISNRYSAEQCEKDFPQYKDSTFKKTWENVIKPHDTKRVFSKDMAQYICNQSSSSSLKSIPSLGPVEATNPTLIPTSSLLSPSIIHTFLIRTPSKAVPSYHRLCYPGSETGFEYWDPEEAGYRELRFVFDFIKEQTGKTPFILDSEDLLKEPEKVMQMWCEEVGVEFDREMLEWNEGTREHFRKWPGFHTSAENSKGVGKGLSKEHITPSNHANEKDGKKPELPKDVQECIDANMDDYEYLKSFVRKP